MIDYNGIGESLRTLIETNVTALELVRYEGDERDVGIHNMPYCDVVLQRSDPELRAGNEYVVSATYVCTLIAFDFTSHNEAATLRNSLVKLAQDAIRANPGFDTDLETSQLGPAEFANARDDESKSFVAMAEFEVDVLVFVPAIT